jgi:putative endonuclease
MKILRGSSNGRTADSPACRQAGALRNSRVNMFIVYILKSQIRDNWSYVGYTGNKRVRMGQHRRGEVIATKGFRPLILVHLEEYKTEDEARKREMFLKTGQGREEKKKILQNIKYSVIV